MKQVEFENIKDKLKNFRFNSMEYYDYDQLKNYEVNVNSEDLFIAVGYDEENKIKKFHWAANNWTELVEAVQKEKNQILITFVPEEWKDNFISAGLKEYAIFREYWISDISKAHQESCEYSLIENVEIDIAAQVTMECRGQSRGFHGESPEWVRSWIDGTLGGLVNAKDMSILVHRENDEVVGIVCVAVYGHKSEKGSILWVRELAVTPRVQGKGIGRSLLKQALTYGVEHGARRAFLMADECNYNAKKLYESIGFVPSKEEVQIDMVYEVAKQNI